MKRMTVLLMLGLFMAAVIASCGGGPKEIIEEPMPVDTVIPEPVVTKPEPPPPPPPKPKLKAEQFKTVYFEFDKFNLTMEAKTALDHNRALFKEFPDAIIKIEGHCDERGTVEYNLSLGEKRAKATMDYLVGLGVKPARLSIISYGKERPVDNGHNETAWAKNRRSEFRIISQ